MFKYSKPPETNPPALTQRNASKMSQTPSPLRKARWTLLSWPFGVLFLLACLLYGPAHAAGYYNTLTFWQLPTGFWSFMSGATESNQLDVHAGVGSANTSNTPGIHTTNGGYNGIQWTDGSGNLWLYGGYGVNSLTDIGTSTLSELWSYTSSSTQWTYLGGNSVYYATPVYGIQGTAATGNLPGPRVNAATSWVNGTTLFFMGGYGMDGTGASGEMSDLWQYSTSSSLWTWLSGNTTVGVAPHYGTIGTASTANTPGGRDSSAYWYDGTNVWLFGGSNGTALLADMFKYTPASTAWTWAGGTTTTNAVGVYGTLGTSSTSYHPGARDSAAFWNDGSNLWLYGGWGVDATGATGSLGDLWKFTPSTSKWTWVSGATTVYAVPARGSLGTGSTSNSPGGRDRAMAYAQASTALWLLGGAAWTSNSWQPQAYNDLWKFTPSNSQWTWISGATTLQAVGSFGPQGVASTTNQPSARLGSNTWTDTSGNFWLFSGYGVDAGGVNHGQKDVWMFSPSTTQWTWQSGETSTTDNPVYGTPGVGATSNHPGPLLTDGSGIVASSFTDSSGNLWLFGGNGYDATGSMTRLNTLWKYTPGTSQWTWVSGTSTRTAGLYGTKGTGSTANYPGGHSSSMSWLDANGKFWIFGGTAVYSGGGDALQNDMWNFDPSNSQWTWISGSSQPMAAVYGTAGSGSTNNIPSVRESAQMWFQSAATVWMFGGSGGGGLLSDLWKFTPSNDQWTWISGATTLGANGIYGTQGVGSTANSPGARAGAQSWLDLSGNLWLFGGAGIDAIGHYDRLNDLWKYSPTSSQWTWVSGSSDVRAAGVYGTLGVASTANAPGARQAMTGWVDPQGNLMLLGGNGIDAQGVFASSLNDYWKFTPANSKWTWLGGNSLSGIVPSYGPPGTYSAAYHIGSNEAPITWVDPSGVHWFFGGREIDPAGVRHVSRELWRLH